MFPEPFIRPLRFSNYHWGPKQVVGQFDVADIRAGKGAARGAYSLDDRSRPLDRTPDMPQLRKRWERPALSDG
jgi:hypothetical protein